MIHLGGSKISKGKLKITRVTVMHWVLFEDFLYYSDDICNVKKPTMALKEFCAFQHFKNNKFIFTIMGMYNNNQLVFTMIWFVAVYSIFICL